MDITYLGAGSVKLSGKNLNVLTDPLAAGKADVVVISGPSTVEGKDWPIAENALRIDQPGEYEVKGAMITGVPARLHIDEDGHRGTAYSILIDGVNVVVA